MGHLLATGSSDFTTRFWERGRPGEESIVEDLNSGDMEKKLLNKKKAMVGTDWDSEYIEKERQSYLCIGLFFVMIP